MRRDRKSVKQHIISLRVSTEEWNSLHEIMQGLQFKRVSDLMREAFKLVLAPPPHFGETVAEGQERIG